MRRADLKTAAFWLCALALLCGRALAGGGDFEGANQAYDQGKFSEAKAGYEKLAEAGEWSANLFYNLGNADYRLGATGRAMLDYERALALYPAHPEARANLAVLRNLNQPLAGTLEPLLGREEGRRYLAQVLVHGLSGRIVSQGQVFNLAMAPQAGLSDAELAAVAGYIARELNNSEGRGPTVDDIAAARAAKPSHKELRELRDRLLK